MIFLSRHGVLYRADPPDINYRANIYALHSLGVTHIIGLSSVGACDYAYKLGTVCLINDFIDFTKSRIHSFDREHRQALHTGMEDVCCPDLNDALEQMILARELPLAHIYALKPDFVCEDMKKTTLEKILVALETETPLITVPDEIAARARRALDAMLELSKQS